MEYFDIKGRIKALNERGFGFFIPDNQSEPFITRNVFFHAVDVIGMNDTLKWEDLQKGMKVSAQIVVVNNKGYQAFQVSIPLPPKKKNRKF